MICKIKLNLEFLIRIIKIGLSDGVKSKIRVTTYDSTNQEKLNASLDKIFDRGTDIVIGPVYSQATKTVVQKAKGKITIFLSLSNSPVVADKNIYMCGHAQRNVLKNTQRVQLMFLCW